MPLFVPCPIVRRSSPEEDYMMTLSGVRSLVDQQQQLLKLFTVSNNSTADTSATTETGHENNEDDETKINKMDKFKESSYMEVKSSDDVTCSTKSSSIQTIRRILEIEELRRFSDALESKICQIES